jgi:2-amino-4-hydroxy-6-hydroxymethyldihydropteridine diphosphokinase
MNDNTVFIGLGTNLGDREENLARALEDIKKIIQIETLSSIYETQPVDYEDQGWFLNMVIKGATNLSAMQLLPKLQAIEAEMGRTRTIKKGPRIIDLDILFYSNEIIVSDDLRVPHPEIQNRHFVLRPLHEIAPDFIHPELHKNISNLFNNLRQDKQVKKWTKDESKN